ncbi:MAG: endo alpha-1,4 polygalactosaminidase [Methanolobus sp.]
MNIRLLFCTFFITFILLTSGCVDNENDVSESNGNESLLKISEQDSSESVSNVTSDIDYRQRMRNFVIGISAYSKQKDPDFIVIPQNGQELLTFGVGSDFLLANDYIAAIDGVGREDLFFGYDDDNTPTSEQDTQRLMSLLDIAQDSGLKVLVTDYCRSLSYVDTSYRRNSEENYISFAADSRDLDTIPDYPAEPFLVNSNNILDLGDARNFLYIINPEQFESKEEFLEALQQTDYDIILIDLFYDDETLTADDIASLKTKTNGGSRLVVAYMSIGEAEDYRYYWNDSWSIGSPEWIEAENPYWEGNYKVQYWDPEWQSVIYGDEDAYLDMIQDSGFDGVYLDIIDAFEYFEEKEEQV